MARPEERVLVVGGGIQGCATAHFLAKRGWAVTLVEKDRIARHASGVNAGGVRRLGRDPAEIPLSLAAMDIWGHLSDEIGGAAEAFHPCFHAKVAIDDKGEALGLERVEALSRAGFSHEVWLGERDLRRRLPHLSTPIRGGILVEGDGWAIPWRIVRGFAEAAARHGAEIVEGCRVVAIEPHKGRWRVRTEGDTHEADQVVVCAGAWAADLARQAGEPALPLKAHAPMLAVTERRPPILPAVLGAIGHTLSLKQLDTGQFVIGGGVRARADMDNNRGEVVPAELARSMRLTARLFSDIASARIIRCWSGIEGYMPDNLPVVGRGKQEGLVLGFGFSAHGFQLGPAVGEALADIVMGRQPRVALEAFRPDRFG